MLLSELFQEISPDFRNSASEALIQLLDEPLNVVHDWRRAERLLLSARAELPQALELAVALYKMYAYENRHDEALALIDEVLVESARQGGFSPEYRELEASATWHEASGPRRLFLYSMKALGFVQLRRERVAEALEVLHQLQRLDPLDQVGGSVVMEIAERVLDQGEHQS